MSPNTISPLSTSTTHNAVPKQKRLSMEKVADLLAEGIRANEKLERRAEKAPAALSTPASTPATDLRTFGRRFSKRYEAETRLYEDRRGTSKRFNLGGRSMDELAELEGDNVQSPPQPTPEEVCMRSARREMTMNWGAAIKDATANMIGMSMTDRTESERWDPSLSGLRDVTAETRMHLLRTNDPQEAERVVRKRPRVKKIDPTPLPDTPTEARMLMVGLISPPEYQTSIRQQPLRRKSKFTEHGLSPGNRRIDDYTRNKNPLGGTSPKAISPTKSRALTIKAPSVSLSIPVRKISPRKTMFVPPGTRSVSVKGTDFDLIEPVKTLKRRSRTLVIPPRSTSKNFSLPLAHAERDFKGFGSISLTNEKKGKTTFMSLPVELRNKVYGLMVIARHEVLICSCGLCSWSATKQPALALASRRLRSEVLPIYYGENRFMIRGEYDWRTKAPAWLRALTQHSRDLIKHIEISTKDITSAICMMATLGFSLSHRLPRRGHIALMREVQSSVIWMTFTAISRKVQAYERLPEIKRAPAISLWDGEQACEGAQLDGADDGQDETDAQSIATIETVCTAILDTDTGKYDGVIGHGIEARRARGRVVTLNSDDDMGSDDGMIEQGVQARRARGKVVTLGSEEAELDRLEELMFREDRIGQRPSMRTKRYSVGRDLVERASMDAR